MKTHKIEIAVDTEQGEEFAAYLNRIGHTAYVGRSTGDYIDGVCTSNDDAVNEYMRELWHNFCNGTA